MMSEEDDVFLSDSENLNAPKEPEYSQIYGHDDVLPHNQAIAKDRNDSTDQNRTPTSSCHDDDLDDLNVIINNARFRIKTIRRKKSSHSSEDDGFDCNNGATRPLMYPRQQCPKSHMTLRRRRCRKCCSYLVYLLLIAGGLSALAFVIVYLVQNYADQWLNIEKKPSWHNQTVVGCTSVSVEQVWVSGIPKLMTESSFRLVDVNRDGVPDILFGFATGNVCMTNAVSMFSHRSWELGFYSPSLTVYISFSLQVDFRFICSHRFKQVLYIHVIMKRYLMDKGFYS
jgi:hypothetical protein